MKNKILLGLVILFCFNIQAFAMEIEVLPSGVELITTEPGKIVTTAFKVSNLTINSQELIANVILPENWSFITTSYQFQLAPNESNIQLVGFFIPARTIATTYHVTLNVSEIKNADVSGQYTISIKVLPVSKIEVTLLEGPNWVIAGEQFESTFAIYNESNIEQEVFINAVSSLNLPIKQDISNVIMPPGTMSRIKVQVNSDDKALNLEEHHTYLNVTLASDEKFKVMASASVDIVPRVTGERGLFKTIPSIFKITQAVQKDKKTKFATQGELSGEGFLDNGEIHHIKYLIRSPNNQKVSAIGKYDEYFLNYNSTNFGLDLGDNSYKITPLTDNVNYGRGISSRLKISNFELNGLYQEKRWSKTNEKDIAGIVKYCINDNSFVGLNLYNKSNDQEQDNILSLYSLINNLFNSSIELEYAHVIIDEANGGQGNDALYLNAEGSQSIVTYRIKYILADPDFPGYFSDKKYFSTDLSIMPFENLTLSGYLRQNQINLDLDTTQNDAYKELFYQIGLNYRFHNGSDIALEYLENLREDQFVDKTFDYKEQSTRIRFSHTLDILSFYIYLEQLEKNDEITKESSDLSKFRFFLYFNPTAKQSYGFFYDHYIESEIGVFGNLSLNNLSNINLSYTRTNHNDEEANTTDKLDFKINYAFINKNELRIHGYSTVSTKDSQQKRTSVLLEYLIPFGLPVGPKYNVGAVKGMVYDAIDNKPIPNVILNLNSASAVTNHEGKYSFPNIQPGNYKLSINSASVGLNQITIQKSPMPVEIKAGDNYTYNFGIVEKATVIGHVLLFEPETAGREDTTEHADQSINTLNMISNSDGSLEYSLYTYAAKISNGNGKSKININANDDERSLTTQGLGSIVVELSNGEETLRRISNLDGKFYFEELRPGRWTIKVYENNIPDYHRVEIDSYEFDLKPGDNINDIDIRVMPIKRSIKILESGNELISQKN